MKLTTFAKSSGRIGACLSKQAAGLLALDLQERMASRASLRHQRLSACDV